MSNQKYVSFAVHYLFHTMPCYVCHAVQWLFHTTLLCIQCCRFPIPHLFILYHTIQLHKMLCIYIFMSSSVWTGPTRVSIAWLLQRCTTTPPILSLPTVVTYPPTFYFVDQDSEAEIIWRSLGQGGGRSFDWIPILALTTKMLFFCSCMKTGIIWLDCCGMGKNVAFCEGILVMGESLLTRAAQTAVKLLLHE